MGTSGARVRVVSLVLLAALARPAAGGEPVVGVQVGAALPTASTQRMVDPGGAIAPYAGYRWGDSFGLAILAQPQMVVMPSNKVVRQADNDDLTSLFSFTAGPRFSYANEHTELYISAQGGIYTPTSGPLGSSAAGFNLGTGLNLRLTDATTLGLFIRRDEPSIKVRVPGRDDDRNVQFLVTGFDLQHRFLPPPPVVEQVAAAPPPPPPAPPIKRKLVLRGVNFDTDKSVIRSDAQPILDEAARALSDNAAVQVTVEGHTDSRGRDDYNQKLSERRAGAVREYLVGKGVAAERLSAVGLGESHPVASNDTAEGMAQNRRVELRVTAGE